MTDDLDTCFAHLAYLRKHLTLAEQQYQDARAMAIPPEVQQALAAVDAACLPQLVELRAALAHAEERLKAAVLAYGRSAKGEGYHAVYHEGKVSWDTRALEGYAAAHNEVYQFKLEGQPYVSLRCGKEG